MASGNAQRSPIQHGRLKAEFGYIDASVYRALQFEWDGHWLAALADLAKRGLIRVIVTEVTRREVASLIREFWLETSKAVRKYANPLRQLGFQEIVDPISDERACVARMTDQFEQWLRRAKAMTCDYPPDVDAILEDYFLGNPPFALGKKKAEFPDAIVASMLRAWSATTKQSTYVISQDGDLKSCCSPEGPLFHAASVGEVISHATASVELHEAVTQTLAEGDRFLHAVSDLVTALPVKVERGYRRGARVEVEVEGLRLIEVDLDEVVVLTFDGITMTCLVYFYVNLDLRVRINQEPVQISADDWEPGFLHTQSISVWRHMIATVDANLDDDGSIALKDAQLDEGRIELSWEDVRREID